MYQDVFSMHGRACLMTALQSPQTRLTMVAPSRGASHLSQRRLALIRNSEKKKRRRARDRREAEKRKRKPFNVCNALALCFHWWLSPLTTLLAFLGKCSTFDRAIHFGFCQSRWHDRATSSQNSIQRRYQSWSAKIALQWPPFIRGWYYHWLQNPREWYTFLDSQKPWRLMASLSRVNSVARSCHWLEMFYFLVGGIACT